MREVERIGRNKVGRFVLRGIMVRTHKIAQRSDKRYAHRVFARMRHIGDIRRRIEQQGFALAVYFDFRRLPPAAYFEQTVAVAIQGLIEMLDERQPS